jgi:TonB family protein
VRQWTFRPLRALGNPVPVLVRVPVEFPGSGSSAAGHVSTDDGDLPKFGEYVYAEELPEAVRRVPAIYADAARAQHIEGTVMVQALVGRDGLVKDTKVVKSIPSLDQAAVEAVRQWSFKPAKAGGKPVAVWVAVPIRFPQP